MQRSFIGEAASWAGPTWLGSDPEGFRGGRGETSGPSSRRAPREEKRFGWVLLEDIGMFECFPFLDSFGGGTIQRATLWDR